MIFLVVEKRLSGSLPKRTGFKCKEIGDSKLEALPAIIIFDAA